MNEENKYNLIIDTSVKAMQAMCIVAILVSMIIICINKFYDINKIWNICFLIPMYSIYFSSVIQNIICFWKITNKDENIKSIKKSRLLFSSCITFIVFLAVFFMYILLSLILFN